MTRPRKPEHPFPFIERGSPSPNTLNALLASASPAKYPRQKFQVIPQPPYLPSALPSPPPPMTPAGTWVKHNPRTPALRRFSRMIKQGARLLLDLDTGKCLVYSFSGGIKVLGTITIRMLSQLLRLGDVVMAARESRWIHFTSPNSNLSWFRPENAI